MAYKSSKTRWGGWSDWIWNPDYRRYYRQRQDIDGNLDFEWHTDGPTNAADASRTAQTPRDSAVDEISQGLHSTHLQGPSATSTYGSQSGEYTIGTSTSKSKSSSSRPKSSTSKYKSSSSRYKGKSRVYDDDDDIDEGEETERETPQTSTSCHTATAEQSQRYYDPETKQYYSYAQTDTSRQPYTSGTATTASTYDSSYSSRSTTAQNSQTQYGRSSYDDEVAEAIAASRRYNYGAHTTAEPSTAAAQTGRSSYEDDDVAAAVAASRGYNYSTQTAGESSTAAAYSAYDGYDDEPRPTTHANNPYNITGTEGDQEHLDPRYRVEHSNKFQPGEIFKVLWSEPQGSGTEGAPSTISDRYEYQDKYGGKIFVGFRRFIVIANDQGHSTCVPVFTYGGKGCNKKGIKANKHGIIHERHHKAKLLPGEPKLGFGPVRMDMYQDGEKLSKESRVNYSKLITVEHNVKVFFIGRVTAADWDTVSEAVNRCWDDKTHHKKKHSR